jgi:chromosome segregation ATPase
MEVQKELLHLIVDEDTRTILDAIIEKMNEVGDDSEHIKQWCDEARAYIPDDNKYNEKYWVAAYILHFHSSVFENLSEQLHEIKSRIKSLSNDLNRLNEIRKETIDEINELHSKIEPFVEQIEILEAKLESIDEACYVVSNNLYTLEHDRKVMVERLRKVVKQITF